MQIERIAATEGVVPGVCSISSVTALNMDISGATQMIQFTDEQMEAASTARLTIGEKQRTLQLLQQDMWLGRDDNDNVTIGVRCWHRLRAVVVLRAECNHISSQSGLFCQWLAHMQCNV
jgi:hypothetical protein